MNINLKNLKVLVTGADGFIGSHLTEKLVSMGVNVKALSFYNAYNSNGWLEDIDEKIKNNFEIVNGDIRDIEFISKISGKVDVIFHLAALISIPYSYLTPRSFINTNVLGTLNILEAAKKEECKRIIFTSTSEVYGTAKTVPIKEEHVLQAQSPYSASKIAGDHLIESYVRSFNLPAVILRPFNTYGPRQSEKAVIPSIIRQTIDSNISNISTGNLSTKRDFNYVSDTVEAFIKLAEAKHSLVEFGKAYNSGTGTAVKISEVLDKVIKLSKSNKKLKKAEERIRPDNSEVELLLASSDKIKKLTGWVPNVTLDTGLKLTFDWWKERLNKKDIRSSSNYAI